MDQADLSNLSKRERQIMDIIYRRKKATAAEVLEEMNDPPSYSAVRAFLRILEEKGYLSHEKKGAKYVFLPIIRHENAMHNAFKNLLQTYFNNSVEDAVAAIIDLDSAKLQDKDYDRMMEMIQKAKENK